MAEAVYKIGIENAVKYDPNKVVTKAEKTDNAGITYNGVDVIAEQPWLLRVEQGAATFFDNINGIFTGATSALNGFISFFKNNWQLIILGIIALIIVDRK